MQLSFSKTLGAALIASTLCASAVFAQAPTQAARPDQAARLSPDVIARLQDGRIAMAKEALKLNDAQLKLWAPVEEQLRSRFAARRERMAKWQQARQQGQRGAELSLPDRLDRASQRMAERAERLKAFNAAFRPFYDSLNDEQKTTARVLLRRGHHHFAHHWAMRQGRDTPPAQQ
jgi:outer membrane lipoprotein-sorting protein